MCFFPAACGAWIINIWANEIIINRLPSRWKHVHTHTLYYYYYFFSVFFFFSVKKRCEFEWFFVFLFYFIYGDAEKPLEWGNDLKITKLTTNFKAFKYERRAYRDMGRPKHEKTILLHQSWSNSFEKHSSNPFRYSPNPFDQNIKGITAVIPLIIFCTRCNPFDHFWNNANPFDHFDMP